MTDEHACNEKNVKVFVRILPLEKPCESCARIDADRKKIYVRCLQEMQPTRIVAAKEPTYWSFQTDGIFHDASQEDVYRLSAADVPAKVLGGASCVILGYGQTGSGKSFTIGGLRNSWKHRGIVARLLSDMFAEKANRKKNSRIEYRLSFVELRGKEVTDLLRTENKIKIGDRDAFKEISVPVVRNEDEALQKIFEGEVKRSIGTGSTYPASHLATAVITIHVSNVSLISSWGVVATAKMHIVDLAGTGTVGKTNCWKPATDFGTANLIKTQLEQYFSYSNATGSSPPAAMRSSNLFKILGNAFSVSSIIRFICHVRITRDDLDITLSTLRFGAKIARLKPVKTKENVGTSPEFALRKLQYEVDALRRELFLNDVFLRQEASTNISKSRTEQINRSVIHFLNGTITDFTLFSACQAQALLKSIKDLYNKFTAKELEMEKLKETYENIARNFAQASGWSSKDAGLAINGLPNNRKRSRNSSRILYESQETGKEQVGVLDKSSVTLGPDADSRIDETKINQDETPERNLRINRKAAVASKIKKLFERFLREDNEHARTKEQLDQIEKTVPIVRERFSTAIDKCYEVKRNLENARRELTKHRQIRNFLETEARDVERRETLPEIEGTMDRDISCYQRALVDLEETVAHAQSELRELTDGRLAIRSKLESAFREYCEKVDPSIPRDAALVQLVLESGDKESSEVDGRRFDRLQRMLLRSSR